MNGGSKKVTEQSLVQKMLCKIGLHRWYWAKGIVEFDRGKVNPHRVELYLCKNNCNKTKVF